MLHVPRQAPAQAFVACQQCDQIALQSCPSGPTNWYTSRNALPLLPDGTYTHSASARIIEVPYPLQSSYMYTPKELETTT